MWKCLKCETLNNGDVCCICGEKRPVVKPPVAPPPTYTPPPASPYSPPPTGSYPPPAYPYAPMAPVAPVASSNGLYIAIGIIGIVTLLAFLFLPLLSVYGVEAAVADMFGSNSDTDVGLLVAIVTIALTIIGGFAKKKKLASTGAILTVCFFAYFFIELSETTAVAGLDMTQFLSAGFWLPGILSIVNIVLSCKAK